eukprot:SAG22_NODE_4132_length_1374_cov_1.377255_1_plen_89_part_00
MEYDPDGSGSIDIKKFTRYVMGSDKGDALSFQQSGEGTKAAAASATWSVEQLERGIKGKMEKSWTQVQNAMRQADRDKSGALSVAELR